MGGWRRRGELTESVVSVGRREGWGLKIWAHFSKACPPGLNDKINPKQGIDMC